MNIKLVLLACSGLLLSISASINHPQQHTSAVNHNATHFNSKEEDNSDWLCLEKIAVSLGFNCTAAYQLEKESLRVRAFPFDWTFSPVESVIACLKNDFHNFFCLENLSHDNKILVTDTAYNITIVHDFPFQLIPDFSFSSLSNHYPFQNAKELIEYQYQETAAKMMRRVERFRHLRFFKGHIFFIRYTNTSKKEALKLLTTLNETFTNQVFTLIVVGHNEKFLNPWNIPNLKNYYIPEEIKNNIFTNNFLTHIFKDAGLLE